jgi:terminase small subunit-like protein
MHSDEINETQRATATTGQTVSAVSATAKGGRPCKYTPETVERLLDALADGLTQKQACIASGIGERTLHDWLERYPELTTQLESARENARQKALAGIQSFGDKDWRALEAFLKLSFHNDYRQNQSETNVNVGVAVGQVCTEEQRKKLIEIREKIGARVGC